MPHDERFFLSRGETENENGSSINLESFLPNEQRLDEKLWHNPENSMYEFKYLLEKYSGEITPTLTRLAQKAINLPLFIREFEADDTSDENNENVAFIAMRNAILLQSYLELTNDERVDQGALNQAIDDAVITGLVSRTLGSQDPDLDDIILLPTHSAEQYTSQPTEFTVLRRKSLGRATLLVADINYQQRPIPKDNTMIYIRPAELTGPKANMQRLAKILVEEQQLKVLEPAHETLIADATSYLYNEIYGYFDPIKPQT